MRPIAEHVRDYAWRDGDQYRRTSLPMVVRFRINQANITETGSAWQAIALAYAKAANEPPFQVVVDQRGDAVQLRFREVAARLEITHRPEAYFTITFGGSDYPVRTPAILAEALRTVSAVCVTCRGPALKANAQDWPTRWQLRYLTCPVDSVLVLEYYHTPQN